MPIIINPGTGPVFDATAESAAANIVAFIADLNVGPLAIRRDEAADSGGRFGFVLTHENGRKIAVDMPGLPIDRVRYVQAPDQNIWNFPRLYVDGSSWVWRYGVNVGRRALLGGENE